MKEMYAWVDWFSQLAEAVVAGGEEGLIDKAKRVEWPGSRKLLEYDKNIDPFSFFYFLSSKATKNNLESTFASVSEEFGINPAEFKYDFGNAFPRGNPQNLYFFSDEKGDYNPELLWKIFRQAVAGNDPIGADDFSQALRITNVGVTKLTQCLFLINPRRFIPVDGALWHLQSRMDLPTLNEAEKAIKGEKGLAVYQDLIAEFRAHFPQCELYDINAALWFIQQWQKNDHKPLQNFFQTSSNVYNDGKDYMTDFLDNNYVFVGNKDERDRYPDLYEVKQGDIIFVRNGVREGRAIGLVYQNDYAEQSPDTAEKFADCKIHVVWLNKQTAPLSGQTVRDGFTRVKETHETYHAFANTDTYKATFKLFSESPPPVNEDAAKYNPSEQTMNQPLNQILYGPPGTGKTYHTVNRAVEIVDPEFFRAHQNDRDELKRRFDELREKRNIEFVTFHQSFGYEQFVEGIAPVLDDADANIAYTIKSGIFKQICAAAELALGGKSAADFDEAVVRFGEYCDDANENDKPIVLQTKRGNEFEVLEVTADRFEIRIKAESRREFKVPIEKTKKVYGGADPMEVARGYHSYARGIAEHLREKYISDTTTSIPHKNHVLIIDEINRGNISRILGELITLLEPSKRLGESEATTVTLPYSNESFGVPENLYIIGTMNTADRSIALLDTALRRRFRFVEMLPKPELITAKVDGVDVGKMLEKMNQRIEELFDRDHQIGHSFFMPLNDDPSMQKLGKIFEYEVLPLLQEYFYGDWKKIDLVLNNNGFVKSRKPKTDGVDEDTEIYAIDKNALRDAEKYKAIYQSKDSGDDSDHNLA